MRPAQSTPWHPFWLLHFWPASKRPSLLSWPAFWLAANVIGLVLTQSRTAYVAFVAATYSVFSSGDEVRQRMPSSTACPILVPLLSCLLIQPTVTRRTEEVSDLEDPNIIMRFAYYQRAIDDFTLSPIFGTGFARYNDQLKIYSGIPNFIYFATSGSVENDDLHAHNSYLHFLAEGGVVGLALMLGVWIATFRWVGKQKHDLRSRILWLLPRSGHSSLHRSRILHEFHRTHDGHRRHVL